jgi:lysophospholipase L1-like esterase
MGRAAVAIGLAATALAVAAGAQERREPSETPLQAAMASPKRRYSVAAMGDSLTDPKSHGGKYLELLRKKCPHSRFDSYGIGGNMVNQMRKRFERDVLGRPADPDHPKPKYTHVIILGGINDICSDETAKRTNDKIKTDLTAMYKLAKADGLEVIALTLPPWGGFKRYYNARRAASTDDMNTWIRAQLGVTVDKLVDIFPVMSCGDRELLCDSYGMKDHVHWNAEGHRVVGVKLYEEIFNDCE